MNVQGAVLLSLLNNRDIKYFDRLHSKYFNSSFSNIYSAISQFYLKYDRLPTSSELNLENNRNQSTLSSLLALQKTSIDDIDPEVALTVLETDYAQQFTLKQIRKLVTDLPFLDSSEILDNVSMLPLTLESEISKSDKVTTSKEYSPFKKHEDIIARTYETYLHNLIDNAGGALEGELILIGGRRGSGKSVICCNIAATAYTYGEIAPYFTIEMNNEECLSRIISVLSRVSAQGVRKQALEGGELLKLAATKALMYEDGFATFEKYAKDAKQMSDFGELVDELNTKELTHPLYVIHDRDLKVSTIDVTITTLKSRYGDKLKKSIVDYVNQLNIDGSKDDKLDWKSQITASTKLKNLADKFGIVMYSPYQIDANGEARLAKGLLDAVDLALTLGKTQNSLSYKLAKTRSLPIEEGTEFSTYMDWDSLSYDDKVPLKEEPEEDEDS